MKRVGQEAKSMARLFVAAVVMVAAISAMGLSEDARPISKTPSPGTQCATTAVANKQNPAASNAPLTAAQGEAILSELHAIRQLLENGAAARAGARPSSAPENVKMRIEPGWHVLGNAHAPVTIVEFTDLQCPFCRQFQSNTFPALKKNYIDTGKVRFIARDLPLPIHAYALGAAEAEHCAGDQGKFWQFRDAVLDDQAPPTADVLLKHATGLGLSIQKFQACLSDGKYKSLVQSDHNNATALGIHGVPAFVIGRTSAGWIEGHTMIGARSFAVFQSEIGSVLNGRPSGSHAVSPVARINPSQVPGLAHHAENR